MKQGSRDCSLDLIKAIAIFMVCETHYLHMNESWIDNLWGITTNMGVPLFFMANGALLFSKKIDVRKHYAKTFKIFALCVLWKIVSVTVASVVNKISPFQKGISPVLNYLLGYNNLEGYELGHFWFMYALVGIYIIFPIFKICLEEKEGKDAVKIVWILTIFFSFGLTSLNVLTQVFTFFARKSINVDFTALNSYNLFGQYGYCLSWFIAGGFLYSTIRKTKMDSKKKKYTHIPDALLIWFFLLGWALLFALNRFQNIVGYANGIVIDGYFQIPTLVMTASLFIIVIRHFQFSRNRFIESISKNSFPIYMLHMLVGLPFLKIQWIYQFSLGIPLNTVKAVYMLLASWGIALLLRKAPVIKRMFEF